MKNPFRLACFALLAAWLPHAGSASPLRLEYDVTALGGGQYDYVFKLSVDNHDNSFAVGQGWSWITFGDVASAPTNLTSFVFDSADFPVGTFTRGDYSGGGHNGPTLLFGGLSITYWQPTAVGSYLQWSGTSTANLGQGSLLFSTLIVSGGAVRADFEVAHLVDFPQPPPANVPDSASTLALIAAAAGILAAGRRSLRR